MRSLRATSQTTGMPARLLRVAALLAAVLTAGPALGQGGGQSVLRGRLTADSGRSAVASAEIIIVQAVRSVRSDSTGSFVIGGLAAGTWSVTVRHPAWKPVYGSFSLGDRDTVEMKVAMAPLGVSLPVVEIRGRSIPLALPPRAASHSARA